MLAHIETVKRPGALDLGITECLLITDSDGRRYGPIIQFLRIKADFQVGQHVGRRMPDAIDAQGEFTAAFVKAAEGYLGNANPHLRRDGKWSPANNIANITPAAVNGAFGVALCGPQASTQGALALVVDPTDIRTRRHVRTGFKSRKTVTSANRGQSSVDIRTGAGAPHRTQNIADAQIGAGPVAEAVSASHDRAGAPLRAAGDASKTIGPKITPKAGQPCLLYTSPSPRDGLLSRMPSS